MGFKSQTYPSLHAHWGSKPAVNWHKLPDRSGTAPIKLLHLCPWASPDPLKAGLGSLLSQPPQPSESLQSSWTLFIPSATPFKTSSLFPFPPPAPATNSNFHLKPMNRASFIHASILSLSSTFGQKKPASFVENSMNFYGLFFSRCNSAEVLKAPEGYSLLQRNQKAGFRSVYI